MDLKDLLPESDTAVIELVFKGKKLVNEDKSPMTVEIYLPHSKEHKAIKHKQADFMISKGTEGLKSAEYEDLGYNYLVDITKGWNITFGGEQPKFSKKKAREVYEALEFITVLIRDELEKSADFT